MNIFIKNKNEKPSELTPAQRMAMIADLDAEERAHENLMHESAKRGFGSIAVNEEKPEGS